MRNKLRREHSAFERDQIERLKTLRRAAYQRNAAALAGCVDAQNQHEEIRISVAGLDKLQQHPSCALGMNEDILMAPGAGLDFVGHQSGAVCFQLCYHSAQVGNAQQT